MQSLAAGKRYSPGHDSGGRCDRQRSGRSADRPGSLSRARLSPPVDGDEPVQDFWWQILWAEVAGERMLARIWASVPSC